MITVTITSQGKYADGKEKCELYINKEYSNKLPHKYGKKTPIDITIGNINYEAGVHETREGVVWISSVLYKKSPAIEKIRLVDILKSIGLQKGDKIKINVNANNSYIVS